MIKVKDIVTTAFVSGIGWGLVNSYASTSTPGRLVNLDLSQVNPPARNAISSSTRLSMNNRFSLDLLHLNMQKINSFTKLKKNWNGYNGEEIDKNVVDIAKELITKIEFQPQVFPTGRGTIQIEKYFDDNNFFELEISVSEICLYKVKNGIEVEKEVPVECIEDIISDLYA